MCSHGVLRLIFTVTTYVCEWRLRIGLYADRSVSVPYELTFYIFIISSKVRGLVAGLSPRRPWFDIAPVHMIFRADGVFPCWCNSTSAPYLTLLLPGQEPSNEAVLFRTSESIGQKNIFTLFYELLSSECWRTDRKMSPYRRAERGGRTPLLSVHLR